MTSVTACANYKCLKVLITGETTTCSVCNVPLYCSKPCLEADAKLHAAMCKPTTDAEAKDDLDQSTKDALAWLSKNLSKVSALFRAMVQVGIPKGILCGKFTSADLPNYFPLDGRTFVMVPATDDDFRKLADCANQMYQECPNGFCVVALELPKPKKLLWVNVKV